MTHVSWWVKVSGSYGSDYRRVPTFATDVIEITEGNKVLDRPFVTVCSRVSHIDGTSRIVRGLRTILSHLLHPVHRKVEDHHSL